MPWDLFDVDAVIDCTGKFREAAVCRRNLDNGANRVLLRTLPLDNIDRSLFPGSILTASISPSHVVPLDRLPPTLLCLLLHIVAKHFAIDCVSMTTIHFTPRSISAGYAGKDFRRSRSAAENIIPNTHEAERWLAQILPGSPTDHDEYAQCANSFRMYAGCKPGAAGRQRRYRSIQCGVRAARSSIPVWSTLQRLRRFL